MKKYVLLINVLIGIFVLKGCVTTPAQIDPAFSQSAPRSILVLPPTNQSNEIDAPYVYLSTISQSIGEQGYYIFPVMVVDAFMRGNGLDQPEEMHDIPLAKLFEVFGQDTVLYLNIEDFGQNYVLLSSTTIVRATARLVESKTGTTIWQGTAAYSEGSGDGGGGIAGLLIAALVEQIVDTVSQRVRGVSMIANQRMIHGLPHGPYRVKRLEELAKAK